MLVPDFESKTLMDVVDRIPVTGIISVDERAKLTTYLRERKEMVRRGVIKCPTWFQEELNKLDSRLRCWWDSWSERWVIDRLQDEGIVESLRRMSEDGKIDAYGEVTGLLANGPFYLTVLQFQPTPTLQLDRGVIELLRKSDMARFQAADYLKKKRDAAEKQQKENERLTTEKVMGAIDKMSDKQLEQFVAVETAIQSGETITAHGSDLKFLEQAQAEKNRFLKDAEERGERPNLDNLSVARNPGMDPRIYKRERKVTT